MIHREGFTILIFFGLLPIIKHTRHPLIPTYYFTSQKTIFVCLFALNSRIFNMEKIEGEVIFFSIWFSEIQKHRVMS